MSTSARITVEKWTVVWVDFEPVVGSEQGGVRPALVVSENAPNSAMSVVNVLPITSLKKGRRIYGNEMLLRAGTAGLTSDSLAMAHQIRAVDKLRLRRTIGTLTDTALRRQVEKTLRLQLGL